MIFILTYSNWYNNTPSNDQLKVLVKALVEATDEIIVELELLNFLVHPWNIEIKNKYNHLLYAANKLNWHVPSNLIFETSKIKTCLDRLETTYKAAEKEHLI